MVFQGSFMVFGWFPWFFKLVSWFFMVLGWFPWFFKVVFWFLMVFCWFPWFFKVVSWFFVSFQGEWLGYPSCFRLALRYLWPLIFLLKVFSDFQSTQPKTTKISTKKSLTPHDWHTYMKYMKVRGETPLTNHDHRHSGLGLVASKLAQVNSFLLDRCYFT